MSDTPAERLTESLAKNDRACARYPMIQTHSVGVMVADLRSVLAENERLRAALERLDLLLDFDSPVSDGLPVVFADTSEINLAFRQARAALATKQ